MSFDILSMLSKGYDLVRKNPVIFVPVLIGAVIVGLINYFTVSNIMVADIVTFADFMNVFTDIISVVFVSLLIASFFKLMGIKMIADSIKGRPDIGVATKFAIGKYLVFILALIVAYIIIGIGLIFLIIPGIYLFVKLFFVPYSIVIDNKSVFSSLEKSWNITKGVWWKILALVLLFAVINGVISYFVAMLPIVGNLLSSIITAIIMVIFDAAFVLVYLKIRK